MRDNNFLKFQVNQQYGSTEAIYFEEKFAIVIAIIVGPICFV